jgi:hypothetical protein
MEAITGVRTMVRGEKTSVLFGTASHELGKSAIFLSEKQVQRATGLSGNYGVLKGSNISVEYYKKGEELINGNKAENDDSIVKSFTIELSEKLTDVASAAAFGMNFTSGK